LPYSYNKTKSERAMKILISTVALGVALLASACSNSEATQERPNVIVILTDDQGYADTGFTGSPDIRTPNIDRIAYEGAQFTNGYVTYAVCGPSRAGLLTGRYQGRFGFDRNPHIDPTDINAGVPLDEKMISEVLAPVGYSSSIIGKWHMGTHPKLHPNNRGFNHFYGFLAGGHRYFPEDLIYENLAEGLSQPNPKDRWLSWYRTKLLNNHQTVETTEYLTDELSNAAVEYIRSQKNSPFFLYLAYNAPHAPLQASQKYLNRNLHIPEGKRRTYAAMISAVDDGVGLILDTLKDENIDNNTMIFFLSDNGGPYKKNGSNNAPFKGGKGEYYEGGIHVPFALRWPAKVAPNTVFDHPVSSLDILATVADITQAPIDSSKPLDGVNLIPYLRGELTGAPHDILFWRNLDKGIIASRQGSQKIIERIKKQPKIEVFNLANDISETTNIASTGNPVQVEQRSRSKQWHDSLAEEAAFKGLILAKKENQQKLREYQKQEKIKKGKRDE